MIELVVNNLVGGAIALIVGWASKRAINMFENWTGEKIAEQKERRLQNLIREGVEKMGPEGKVTQPLIDYLKRRAKQMGVYNYVTQDLAAFEEMLKTYAENRYKDSSKPKKVVENMPLGVLPLPKTVISTLRQEAGLKHVEDLESYEGEFQDIKGIGPERAEDIKQAIEDYKNGGGLLAGVAHASSR